MPGRKLSPIDRAERRVIQARGDLSVSYEVLGRGEQTLMLANGLGGRLYAWEPLIDELSERYRIITWDYRGLFDSPYDVLSHLSVRDHAEDALKILDAEGVRRAVWIGWSMGVQVSLEAASISSERFAGLVLLNGTYGHVFSSGFQPWFRIPVLPRYLHEITEWIRDHPGVSRALAAVSKRSTSVILGLFWLVVGRRALGLRSTLQQYTDDVYKPENFPNYLRLFQELDAHSAFHHLPRLCVPALVISGRFDVLTPPYQSREIARRLPDADYHHIRNGSHFVLLERPEQVLPRIDDFLRRRAAW